MSRDEYDMVRIARHVLEEQGFEPDAPSAETIGDGHADPATRDLRDLAWSSIDNDDSRDLDQIEWAEQLEDGAIRMLVGIADVSAFVARDSEIDRHAATNTATLYTGVKTFHMLPQELATDRTSLLDGQERLAVVTETVVLRDGTVDEARTQVYPARVVNKAKLVYEEVGAWLEGDGGWQPPNKVIEAQLKLQDEATHRLRKLRQEHGALELETIEARTVSKDGKVVDLELIHKNRARELVEDLMISANGATARFLEIRGYSSIRRVVRAPQRWPKIVEIAQTFGTQLPPQPDVKSLGQFVVERRHAMDRESFADLSLTIVKLLGPGEYLLQRATDPDTGHFGLAVSDYMHSTAPNRRYPDLVTQRLLKAAAAKQPAPYSDQELADIAARCTERENANRKVERTMRKVAAAALLHDRVGERFKAIVTGVKPGAVFARLLRPPAEGRVVRGERGLDVGDHIFVKLLDTVVERGFIDFASVD